MNVFSFSAIGKSHLDGDPLWHRVPLQLHLLDDSDDPLKRLRVEGLGAALALGHDLPTLLVTQVLADGETDLARLRTAGLAAVGVKAAP